MKALVILFTALLISACSPKELWHDIFTDDAQLNALEADIDALKDSGTERIEERIAELRAQLDVVRDAAKGRRDELARELAARIEVVKLLK